MEFDVYLSHVDADQELACKVYDCFAKCSSASGCRVRVFLRNVSYAHTSRQITAEAALHRSTVFVPVFSMKSISVCGGIGNEHIAFSPASRWEVAAERFAIGLTALNFVVNLVSVFGMYGGRGHGVELHYQYRGWYLASVVVPRVFNTTLIARKIQTEQRDHPRFAVWLQQNLQVFSAVVLLACLRLDNFALLQSARLFACPPPMSIAVVNKSKAFGIVNSLFGDCPQLIISMLVLLRDDVWGFAGVVIIVLCQITISTASLLHQLIIRGLALVLISAPHVEQELLDQISETGQVLDCMIADDLQRRHSRRDRSKLAAVLPLVVDPQCLDVNFSAERIPAKVMEQYTDIMGAAQFAHRIEPPRVGTLLSGIVQSVDAIKLWCSAGAPVDSTDQCDFAAQAVALCLDRLGESGIAGSGEDGGEFRPWQDRAGPDPVPQRQRHSM